MAAAANVMIFVPTALDTYIQAQGGAGASPPNAGLSLILNGANTITRTSATVNSVAGFAYQGDMGALVPLWDWLRLALPDR